MYHFTVLNILFYSLMILKELSSVHFTTWHVTSLWVSFWLQSFISFPCMLEILSTDSIFSLDYIRENSLRARRQQFHRNMSAFATSGRTAILQADCSKSQLEVVIVKIAKPPDSQPEVQISSSFAESVPSFLHTTPESSCGMSCLWFFVINA